MARSILKEVVPQELGQGSLVIYSVSDDPQDKVIALIAGRNDVGQFHGSIVYSSTVRYPIGSRFNGVNASDITEYRGVVEISSL